VERNVVSHGLIDAESFLTIIRGKPSLQIELVKQTLRRGRSRGHGIVLDRNWIDSTVFDSWKSYCRFRHGEKCHANPLASFLPAPQLQWLIDVSRDCLVPAEKGATYVCLSYVWGKKPFFKALKSNILHLQQPNSLSSIAGARSIPRTIIDAMNLVGTYHLKVHVCLAS